ncbi:MAG: XRE family transcriptional regulator [Oscillospiraceae bacterium]|nr:XRE family transcriptional regulator [Oscillospiraceae bacterium]
MTKQEIGAVLLQLRERSHKTREEVAELLGKSVKTIGHWETGYAQPDANTLFLLCAIYDADLNASFGFESKDNKNASLCTSEAIEIAKRYDVLDEHGKEVIEKLLDCEETRLRQQKPAPTTKIIPLLGNSFAAGRGEPDFGNPWEDYEVPIDTKADFAIRINGDSMEPYLPDGSVQLCRKGEPRDGEVGVFVLDGEYLCKQACVDCYGNLYLFSLNRARSDADTTVWASADRQVGCYGTVIMPRRVPLPPL